MKKQIILLSLGIASLFLLVPFQAQAWIIKFSVKNGDVCLSGGEDKGFCAKGIKLPGFDDIQVIINGKPVKGDIVEVVVNKNNEKMGSITVKSGKKPENNKSVAPEKAELANRNIDLGKVQVKNLKTGETLSLSTLLELSKQCGK